LDDTETEKNPFVAPCQCSGSVRFIHLECLRNWIAQKKQCQYDNGVFSYFWEEIACELCKSGIELKRISCNDT
jgi:E3 ubiquitin-protein ligase DOA10